MGVPCDLRTQEADGRAGVRDHQISVGLSPVPAARAGECPQRMDAGVPHVELETHGRIAPAIRPKGITCGEIRSP